MMQLPTTWFRRTAQSQPSATLTFYEWGLSKIPPDRSSVWAKSCKVGPVIRDQQRLLHAVEGR